MYMLILIFVLIIFVIWILFGRKDLEFQGLQIDNLIQDEIDHTIDISNEPDDQIMYRSSHLNRDLHATRDQMRQLANELRNIPVTTTEEDLRRYPWKGERYLRNLLTNIYQRPFDKIRPDFLRNPETGYRLELDCYNEELKIAAEYNGIQHYVWPNYTNQSKEEFLAQRRRDGYKRELCDNAGVYLITIPYTVPISRMIDYLLPLLPEFRQSYEL